MFVRDDRCARWTRGDHVHGMEQAFFQQGLGRGGGGWRGFCLQTPGRKKTVVKRLFESGIRNNHTDPVPMLTRCSGVFARPIQRVWGGGSGGGEPAAESAAKRLSRSFEKTGGCVKTWRIGSNSVCAVVRANRRERGIELEGEVCWLVRV